MSSGFQWRHLPALFTACAQCWGTIYPLIDSTRGVMLQYGFSREIANVPETWPVWHVGQARTTATGILMFIFYAQRRYEVLDTFLVVIGAYLGVADCVLLWRAGLKGDGVFRLLASSVFAVLGWVGFTQGSSA